MDDQRITGTRDTTYDLVSVIYHALQGAQTNEAYARDSAETGDAELVAFFREAQQQQRQLADRAKGLLGARLSQAQAG